jgi:hypothetical protein
LPGNCGEFFSFEEASEICSVPQPTNTPVPQPTSTPAPTASPCGGLRLYYPQYECIDGNTANVRWWWNYIVGTSVYQLQVSTSPDFSSPLLDTRVGGVTVYTHRDFNDPSQLIYARVRVSENKYGCPSGYSWSNVIASFDSCTSAAPFPTPVPINPLKIFFCDTEGSPTDDPDTGKIYSAIGCIPTENLQLFSVFAIRWSMGIAGGITLVLIVYSGILFTTSRGDANKIKLAKELLTAAVGGLMFLIFSSLIYRTLFTDLFGLPNF